MLPIEDVLKLSHKVMQSGHWYLNLNKNRLFWSDEVFRIHGYEPGDIQLDLTTAINFYHPEDRERVSNIINKTLKTYQPLNFVAHILRKDGTSRVVHSQGEIKYGEEGHPTHLFGVIRDITEEWAQQQHHRRLASSLENTDEAIVMTNPSGFITWANSAFTRITGFPEADFLGRKPGDFLQGPETDPATIAYMRSMLSRRESFTTEVLNHHRDGHTYWVRISCQPDFDENDQLLGFSTIQSDITNEKELRLNLQEKINSGKILQERLRYIASHDELSEMPNRRYFMTQAEIEIGRCRRHDHDLCLLLADLDHFKTINDTHGHAAGDSVIKAFATLCENTLRHHDLAARIGGEEFAILLPETDLEGGQVLAERLRQALANTPAMINGEPIFVTASIGVTMAAHNDADVGTMLARADKALYQAKTGGRNQVISWMVE
ncbi:GGDEF domain-containing protein [Vreelandella salicampi]|uniref:Diguanylate cyclase n=1 Tax=Vreelandella salicampi TaxID=1449798 RepID=A0A7Z0LND5_9GAMM|nr:sensor domain-containing diguanylate cyclase [Halomonas salicampi]NYS62083.1 diguanylate cyclase [Halomonas salicampi]